MPSLSRSLEQALHRAIKLASDRHHEYATLEHLLLALVDDEHYRQLQLELVARPESGVLIRGSGGLRKLRWYVRGGGKRGGLRVIYYWAPEHDHCISLDDPQLAIKWPLEGLPELSAKDQRGKLLKDAEVFA